MSLHNKHQQQQQQQQQQPHHLPYPAVHLLPHKDTFIPKQIVLKPNGTKVVIGRQSNTNSIPHTTNGFFDSEVLSRAHAEVWFEDGKVLIRDIKSSNGTFINGERLSGEGVKSEAFELHTDDVVEFGIDIIADDNKSVVHHKVATKVFLVLNPDDAIAASNFYRYRTKPSGSAVNRRSNPPGVFAGGSLDNVSNRLQSELEKSRATGKELNKLNSTMNEIHDTLDDGAGPPLPLSPPCGGRISPLNHQHQPQLQVANALQFQLAETQASLNSHIEKAKTPEGLMGEHKQLKRKVGELRDQLESERSLKLSKTGANNEDEDAHTRGRVSPVEAMLELQGREQEDSGGMDDNDKNDNRSMASNNAVTRINSPSSCHGTKKSNSPGSGKPTRLFCTRCRLIQELDRFDGHQLEKRFGRQKTESVHFKKYDPELERTKGVAIKQIWCTQCAPKMIAEAFWEEIEKKLEARVAIDRAVMEDDDDDDDE